MSIERNFDGNGSPVAPALPSLSEYINEVLPRRLNELEDESRQAKGWDGLVDKVKIQAVIEAIEQIVAEIQVIIKQEDFW